MLQSVAVCCSVLQCVETLQQKTYLWAFETHHTATHCNTLQHTATHCNTLRHTLQHTSSRCNKLHHAATKTYLRALETNHIQPPAPCVFPFFFFNLEVNTGKRGLRKIKGIGKRCVAVCCSVLQCVVVCCSVCVAVCCSGLIST